MSLLEMKQGVKIYQENDSNVYALNEVNLTINQGELVAILGTSGSGKSTLLHMLGGLDTLSSGAILLNGKEYKQQSDTQMSKLRRRKFGFVFQSFQLLPNLRIYDNIILPIKLDKRKADEDYINSIVSDLGLQDVLKRLPSQLSGGQQQRVAIARALANRPEIVFADEPTGNLDTKTGREVMDLFVKEVKTQKHTMVMVTHNEELANRATRVIKIEDGKIVYDKYNTD